MAWVEKLEDYVKEQGLTVAEWLRKNDVPLATYYYWKKGGKPSFRWITKLVDLTKGHLSYEDFRVETENGVEDKGK